MTAALRLALAVALVWLRPLHTVRTISGQREDIRLMVRTLAAALDAEPRPQRRLYLVK